MILILLAHDQPMYRLIENQIGFAWTFCFSELGFGSYVHVYNQLKKGFLACKFSIKLSILLPWSRWPNYFATLHNNFITKCIYA